MFRFKVQQTNIFTPGVAYFRFSRPFLFVFTFLSGNVCLHLSFRPHGLHGHRCHRSVPERLHTSYKYVSALLPSSADDIPSGITFHADTLTVLNLLQLLCVRPAHVRGRRH